MRRWRMSGARRLLSAALSAVLLMSSVTIPVAANYVDDELKGYAEQLAEDGSYTYKASGEVKQGKGGYDLNVTAASTGYKLYVIETKNTTGYTGAEGVSVSESNKTIECSVFYLGSDNCVYWTEPFSFFKAAAAFTGKNAGAAGGTDAFSILLPSSCQQVLGVYLHKEGTSGAKAAWGAEWLRVVEYVSITETKQSDGKATHTYRGTYAAGVSDLNELDEDEWGSHFWALNKTLGANTAGAAIDGVYLIEVVTGSNGYAIGTGAGGSITVNYVDTAGKSGTKTVELATGALAAIPDTSLSGAASPSSWGSIPTADWLKLTDREMTALASGYVGNYFPVQSYKASCLSPYSASFFAITMPKNINTVNSIAITLANNGDSMDVQSIRLIDGSGTSGSYFNGSLSAERVMDYSGTLVAETTCSQRTINAQGTWRWENKSTTPSVNGLASYAYGTRRIVYSTATGVGVSIRFADIVDAGIETLLAKEKIVYADSDLKFGMNDAMKKTYGDDAAKALHNLGAFYKEPLQLEVTYKDTFGSTRKVTVPFMTAYLLCALQNSGGKLTGGSYTTWISGIFQQNENAAVTLRLAEYQSLVSVRLTYGSAMSGLSSSNSASIDTANDSIAIENLCVYEKVTSSSFKSSYDKSKLAVTLTTSLTPSYSWSAAGGEQGKKLSAGGVIEASVADGTLVAGAPSARSYANKYVVSIKTADIESADTHDDVDVSIAYTDTSGMKKSTPVYAMRSLVNAFYGSEYKTTATLDVSDQYARHLGVGCTASFVIELADVESIDSITLSLKTKSGINTWQVEAVNIYKLSSLSQRAGSRIGAIEGAVSTSYILWDRAYSSSESDRVAYARQSVLLYLNNPSKTIYFTKLDDSGAEVKPDLPTKKTEYLTTLPTEMTYEETLKDLGLSIVKCNYRIDVEVSDLDDAGSTNYFYFQLVFENGTSAVVLANQQLASDSFRQGCTESFRIKTTQNYGDVKAVRIICDASSSTSNVFDKLNISQISVTLDGASGVSRTWLVENVGWIDITYVDEGEDQGVDGLESMTDRSVTNAEITKEFVVTRMATSVDLLFCIKTASTSTGGITRFNNLQETFEATLVYLDGNGVSQSKSFDLKAAINEYNDMGSNLTFRPGHTDRFRLTMTDIGSVSSIIITRSGQSMNDPWVIESIAVLQVGGLGDVYLSANAEYYRDPVSSEELTTSNNSAGTNYTLLGSSMVTIPFGENHIDVAEDGSDENIWNATISRVPTSKTETLNITIFPGAGYTYHEPIPEIRAAVQYNTLHGDELKQTSFDFRMDGELDGERVLYTKRMEVDAMSTFHNLKLSCLSEYTNMPTVGRVIVQRVRDGVILGTYSFNYGNHSFASETVEMAPTVLTPTMPMQQKLTMQVAAGQNRVLASGSSDVAVALRYTSTLDPAENGKSVYQTPYVSLTDAGYAAIREGQIVELAYATDFVDEIVGIAVIADGEPVLFDCAVMENYSGAGELSEALLLSSASIAEPFTATTFLSTLGTSTQSVTPVTFTFTTGAENNIAGAGTSGKAAMTIHYTDSTGGACAVELSNLLRRLSGSPTAGSSVTLRVLLPDFGKLENIAVTAEDSWFLTAVSATVEKSEGDEVISTTVNNWARAAVPLTVDLSEFERYNYVQTFSVTGRINDRTAVYSASAGGTMSLTVDPGDRVTLLPAVTAVGSPDMTWTWLGAGVWGDDVLHVNADGSAVFEVPSDWENGSSATISVVCNGDRSKSIVISFSVVYYTVPSIGELTDGDWQSPDLGGEADMPSREEIDAIISGSISGGTLSGAAGKGELIKPSEPIDVESFFSVNGGT